MSKFAKGTSVPKVETVEVIETPVTKVTREIPNEFLTLTPKGGWDLEISFPRTEGRVEATVHQHSDPSKGDNGKTALWLFTADKGGVYTFPRKNCEDRSIIDGDQYVVSVYAEAVKGRVKFSAK